jgi:hypothetical protein
MGMSSEVDQVMEKILAMVVSLGDKQDNQIDKMADIMRTMTDAIKSIKESNRTLAESYLKLQQRELTNRNLRSVTSRRTSKRWIQL